MILIVMWREQSREEYSEVAQCALKDKKKLMV